MTRKKNTRRLKRKRSARTDQLMTELAKELDAAAKVVDSLEGSHGWTPFDPSQSALSKVTRAISNETDEDFEFKTIDGFDDAVCGYDFDGEKYVLRYCLTAMQFCCMRRGLNEADTHEELHEVVLPNIPHDGPVVLQQSVTPTIRLIPQLQKLTEKMARIQKEFFREK